MKDETPEDVIQVEWEQLPQREKWAGKEQQKPTAEPRARASPGALRASARPPTAQAGGWEYLDHTADVQVHAWGAKIEEAFGAAVVGMFGYMVELDEISNDYEMEVTADAHDWVSLLYAFMDECLYVFHTESFAMKEINVTELDTEKWVIRAVARGGMFDNSRHAQGTEVKAITYSNMQIKQDTPGRAEVYVIVDI